MTVPNGVVGVLLAGGKSSRMGGGDKCLHLLGGAPILARVIDRVEPQVSDLVINANGDPARFADFGLPVVADSVAGYQGPLAGIAAALEWVRANRPGIDHVVTIAADTPFVPADLVRRFVEVCTGPSSFCIAQSAAGIHPVIGLWPVCLVEPLFASLERGERRAKTWTKDHGAIPVFFAPIDVGGQSVDPFFNINAPEDLAAAEVLLGEPCLNR